MSKHRIVIRRVPSDLSLDVLILYIESEIGEGTVNDKDPETRLSPDHKSASICLIDATAFNKAQQLHLCIHKRPLLVESWTQNWADKKTEKWITSTGGTPANGSKKTLLKSVPFFDFPDDPEPEIPVQPKRPARPTTARHHAELEVPVAAEKLDFVYRLAKEDHTISATCNIEKSSQPPKLVITGSQRNQEEMQRAKNKVLDIISKTEVQSMPSYSREAAELLVSTEYFEIMALAFKHKAIEASLALSGYYVMLIARNHSDMQTAKKIFDEKVKIDMFSVNPDFDNMIKTDRWGAELKSKRESLKIIIRQESGKPVRIVLEGLSDRVDQAKASLQDWLKNNTVGQAKVLLQKPIWRLLKERCSDFIEHLKQDGLKKHEFIYQGGNNYLQVEGSPSFISDVTDQLRNQGTAVCRSKVLEVTEEGLDINLLLNDPGKSRLQQIEISKKCIIEIRGGGVVTGADDDWDTGDSILAGHMQVASPKRKVVKRTPMPPPQNLKLETGDITQSTKKVLVCTIPFGSKSLEKAGILGRNFSAAGGDTLKAAFQKLSEDNRGKIPLGQAHLVDQVGNLGCSYVIFIILRKWEGRNIGRIEKVIKSLVFACLEKCKSVSQHSIAFPTLGAGRLNFPQNNVARCFKETVSGWNRRNTGYSMDVQVIAHEDPLRDRYKFVIENQDVSDEEGHTDDDGDDASGGATAREPLKSARRTRAPKQRIELQVYALDDTTLHSAMDDIDTILKGLLHKKVIKDKFVQLMSDQDKRQIKKATDRLPGIRVIIEKDNIIIVGAEDMVSKAAEIVYAVTEEIEKRLKDPDEIRRNEGDNAYLQALFSQNLEIPKHWNMRTNGMTTIEEALQARTEKVTHHVNTNLRTAIERLINSTWNSNQVGKGKDASGLNHSAMKIIEIHQIENPRLFKAYGNHLQQKCLDVGQQRARCVRISQIDNKQEIHTVSANIKELDSLRNSLVNEFFLFHGAPNHAVSAISEQGIDARVFSDGLFGKGAYFAESPTKADQYSDRGARHGGDHYMFLCRVVMLDPFVCAQHRPFCRPPCKYVGCNNDLCSQGHEFHDSVLGVSTGAPGAGRLLFREFVIYEKIQCYPAFLIKYQRV